MSVFFSLSPLVHLVVFSFYRSFHLTIIITLIILFNSSSSSTSRLLSYYLIPAFDLSTYQPLFCTFSPSTYWFPSCVHLSFMLTYLAPPPPPHPHPPSSSHFLPPFSLFLSYLCFSLIFPLIPCLIFCHFRLPLRFLHPSPSPLSPAISVICFPFSLLSLFRFSFFNSLLKSPFSFPSLIS